MKHAIALCAGLLAFGATASAGDLAQPVLPGYPDPVYPGYALGLPPHEIVTIVRSTGLEPLHRPVRHGPTYALRAVDPAGQEMRVIVDARSGRVLRIVPVLGPRYAVMPPPYGRPPGRIAMVPDGYGPNSRITALPPGVDGPPVIGPGVGAPPIAAPRAPAAAAPPPPAGQAGPLPLPRPRPKVAATQSPAAPAAKPTTVAPPQAAPPAPSQAEARSAGETTGAVTPPAANPAPPVEE